jgi:transposase
MRRCDRCGHARACELADGRFKCKACGRRYTWTKAWASIRLAEATNPPLLELFVAPAKAPTIERFYRLARACRAYVDELRELIEGAIECDETTIGGARRGKRGWGAAGKGIVLGIL